MFNLLISQRIIKNSNLKLLIINNCGLPDTYTCLGRLKNETRSKWYYNIWQIKKYKSALGLESLGLDRLPAKHKNWNKTE